MIIMFFVHFEMRSNYKDGCNLNIYLISFHCDVSQYLVYAVHADTEPLHIVTL